MGSPNNDQQTIQPNRSCSCFKGSLDNVRGLHSFLYSWFRNPTQNTVDASGFLKHLPCGVAKTPMIFVGSHIWIPDLVRKPARPKFLAN